MGKPYQSVVTSSAACRRMSRAGEWLEARAPGEEILILGASRHAADDLVRRFATTGDGVFGWHRLTLPQLAAAVAACALAWRGLAPLSRLGTEAIATRVVHRLGMEGRLRALPPGQIYAWVPARSRNCSLRATPRPHRCRRARRRRTRPCVIARW